MPTSLPPVECNIDDTQYDGLPCHAKHERVQDAPSFPKKTGQRVNKEEKISAIMLPSHPKQVGAYHCRVKSPEARV